MTSHVIDTDSALYRGLKKAVREAIEEMGLEEFKQCSFFPSSDYHKPGGRGHKIAQRIKRCRETKEIADVAQR